MTPVCLGCLLVRLDSSRGCQCGLCGIYLCWNHADQKETFMSCGCFLGREIKETTKQLKWAIPETIDDGWVDWICPDCVRLLADVTRRHHYIEEIGHR